MRNTIGLCLKAYGNTSKHCLQDAWQIVRNRIEDFAFLDLLMLTFPAIDPCTRWVDVLGGSLRSVIRSFQFLQ